MFRRISLVLILFALVGCGPKATPPNLTPAQQTQYVTAVKADQTVTRVNELMNVTIMGEANGGIPRPTARIIVQFCVDADKILDAAPNGWQNIVKTLWITAKADPLVTPYLTNFYVVAAISLVDAAISSWGI